MSSFNEIDYCRNTYYLTSLQKTEINQYINATLQVVVKEICNITCPIAISLAGSLGRKEPSCGLAIFNKIELLSDFDLVIFTEEIDVMAFQQKINKH